MTRPLASRWLLRPAVIVAVLALSGCATIAGRHQIVSIDSEVRGLEVSEQGRVLGRTPLFIERERSTQLPLTLRAPSGETRELTVHCDYRWLGSLLANAPLVAASWFAPWAGPAALVAGGATDLATGSAFDCPIAVRAPAEAADEAAKGVQACPRVVVLPPPDEDERIGRIVARHWKERFHTSRGCGDLADESAADRYFMMREDFHVGLGPGETFERAILNDLGHRTRATHAVELRVDEPVPGRLTVSPRWHDLHSLEVREEEPFEVNLDTEPTAPHNLFSRQAGSLVRLMPNAISFSAAQKDPRYLADAGWRIVSNGATPNALPSILSQWSIGWVEPPGLYGPWGIGFSASPTLVATFNEHRLAVQRGSEPSLISDVGTLHALALFDATVSLRTPVGRFGVVLGAGAGTAWLWKDAAYQSWTFRPYGEARIDYTAFLNERLFVRMALQGFKSPTPHARGEGWSLSDFTQVSLALGYRIPELKSWARNLF